MCERTAGVSLTDFLYLFVIVEPCTRASFATWQVFSVNLRLACQGEKLSYFVTSETSQYVTYAVKLVKNWHKSAVWISFKLILHTNIIIPWQVFIWQVLFTHVYDWKYGKHFLDKSPCSNTGVPLSFFYHCQVQHCSFARPVFGLPSSSSLRKRRHRIKSLKPP